jgi:5-formyltetrahydrofolate cyclo-ligase
MPRVVGVGLSGCQIQTIYPMPWDIPMDAIALSNGTVAHRR